MAFALVEAVAWCAGVVPRTATGEYQARAKLLSCRFTRSHLELCDPAVHPRVPGRRSVFVLGASSVVGYPAGEKRNIPSFLRARLDEAFPGRFRVYRLALPCKDSFFLEACARRALPARPDAIVFYEGHNDTSAFLVPHPRLALFVARHPWLMDLRALLAHTRTYSLLTRDAPLPTSLIPAESLPDPAFGETLALVVDTFAGNLERLVEEARAAGVEVFLVTVVSNLHEYPFRMEEWDRALRLPPLPEGPLRRWQEHYASGIRLFREGRRREARIEFEAARDWYPFGRAPAALNERIRALARGRPGVHLVDFERELVEIAGDEPIGCNFFGTEAYCDHLHPNPATSARIADAVAREIAAFERPPPR